MHVTVNENFQLRSYALFFVSAGTRFLLLFILLYAGCGLLYLGDCRSELFSCSNGNTSVLKITLLALLVGNAQQLACSPLPSPAR